MFRPRRRAEDFAEEIRAHLELEMDELRRQGLSEEEARRRARSAFGSIAVAEERFHLRGRWQGLDKLARDLRFGVRSLLQSPGFALTAILTVALGVGANTAVFSVMNAVLLRSLPVHDAARVVLLRVTSPPNRTGTISSHETFSWPVYEALRHEGAALSEVVAVGALSSDKVNVRMDAEAEAAEGDMVSGNFFSGLGVRMERGRGFTARDEAERSPAAVLSYNYWTRRFARDPGVLGRTMSVKGVPFTVVGVAAEGFEGTEPGRSLDFWIPLQNRVEFNVLGNPPAKGKLYQQDPTWWCLNLMARLAPGVSRQQALSAVEPVFQRAAYAGLGAPQQGEKPPVLSFEDARNFSGYEEQYGKPLGMLMGMVGFVLLIALANVTMLLLARNAARQREFSVRLALGAGRIALLRQLLVEGLLLTAAGGVLAWGFAVAATHMLAKWALIETSLAPDRTVLLFTFGVLTVAALVFALTPFRLAMAGGGQLALKTHAATTHSDAGTARAGKAVITLQMALCLALLVGAGLLVRTLYNLRNIPLGMDTDGLVVFGLDPQGMHSEAERVEFYRELQSCLRTLPGVESVTVMVARLGSGWSNNSSVTIDGKTPDPGRGGRMTVRQNDIGPDFFHTLGVPVLEGREFTDGDKAGSPPVAIVSQLFAQTFFPGESPIGHKVNGLTIVGVAANHKYRGMSEAPIPMAWWDYAQAPEEAGLNVEMRVRGDALAILPAVRKVVAQMDPNQPLIQPILQREQFERTISHQLLFARLAEFFGLLAMALVATGLYGTLAYRVSLRTTEIGIRMALGAGRSQVMALILGDSLLLTMLSVAVGVPLAIFVGRALASSLYGVKPLDVITYAMAIAGVTVVALAASAAPAARAASVDPMQALRSE